MTPRDRATRALDHEEVYPVPVDLFDNGIYPTLQGNLCERFGLARDDLEGLMEQLGAAFRWAGPVYIGPPLLTAPKLEPGYPHRATYVNIWGT